MKTNKIESEDEFVRDAFKRVKKALIKTKQSSLKRRLRWWWSDSWINHITHNCDNNQKKLTLEDNGGYESYCKRCGVPR